MKLIFSSENPPLTFCLLSVLSRIEIVKGLIKEKNMFNLYLVLHSGEQIQGDSLTLARVLCATVPEFKNLLVSPLKLELISCKLFEFLVEEWLEKASYIEEVALCQKKKEKIVKAELAKELSILNSHLLFKTYLVEHQLTLADIIMFTNLGQVCQFYTLSVRCDYAKSYPHVIRWWNFILHSFSMNNEKLISLFETNTMQLNEIKTEAKKQPQIQTKSLYEGKLPNAIEGKVVTRLPPEPSGYLHIGHAKAALLNNYYAKYYDGKFLIRFDDTNPIKEKKEFEEAILDDLKLLKVDTSNISHTSDYFDKIESFCEKLIREGKCYADNTPVETMRKERTEGIESVCRSSSIENNLRIWEAMKQGDPIALSYCIRAKLDMSSKNKCMRDFVVYRCITDIPHHIHGFKYKVYPTYDFACPIVDSLQGVTHAMRTNEYADRIPQYEWVLNACGLMPITIYEFSRLNFVNTVLSKRKLQWFVEQNFVESWEDPRFPTVRGLIRRGLQVEALLEFLLEQGPSKNTNLMEWDKLWTKNKQLLDPIVPRFMAVAKNSVIVKLLNGPEKPEIVERELHPKNLTVGKGTIVYYKFINIEYEDALCLSIGEEITLMRWGNAIVSDIIAKSGSKTIIMTLHPEGNFKTTKKKIHWVATPQNSINLPASIILREYDHLIKKKKPEENDEMKNIINRNSMFDTIALMDNLSFQKIKQGDILQFERRGYFRCDKKFTTPNDLSVFIKIPDGKAKNVSIFNH